jgi:hypothetical protein
VIRVQLHWVQLLECSDDKNRHFERTIQLAVCRRGGTGSPDGLALPRRARLAGVAPLAIAYRGGGAGRGGGGEKGIGTVPRQEPRIDFVNLGTSVDRTAPIGPRSASEGRRLG